MISNLETGGFRRYDYGGAMFRPFECVLVSMVVLVTAFAAGRKLELRGRIEPPPGPAIVMLHGNDFPYSANTLSDSSGRFKFKKLEAGAYTVLVFLPGRGEVRRTVVLSPSLADAKGRVSVTVPFHPSGESIERSNAVSVRELSIPKRARREYAAADKRLHKHDVEGAKRHLQRAVEIAPNYVAAWNHLGTIAYLSGRYEQAAKYFREALKHEPGAYSPVVNLGGALLTLRKFHEALPYNQYAYAQRPGDALANSQLGKNYFYLGEEEKALKYLKAAKRIDPDHFSRPQLTLAQIYLDRRENEKAARELEDFLARHPDDDSAAAVRRLLVRIRKR